MSGHNKWKQIKERKSKTDSQKSKLFSKYAKLISIEAKKANGNKEYPSLKALIARAKADNMPNDNIDRAVKKASDANTAQMETILYEAYGPGGSALIIEAITDNRNKASQEIKNVFSKHNMTLASPGSAMWAFTKDPATNKLQPTTTVPLEENDLIELEKIIEALEDCDEIQEVFTNAE
jgi:YebC/PmpR family DNA-binding regulatory protein